MNEAGYRVSRHEAHHTAAFATYDWPLGAVSLEPWHGLTRFVPKTDGSILTRAYELAVVTLAPAIVDPRGTEADMGLLTEILAATTRLRMSHVWDEVHSLIADPDFQLQRAAIEQALMTRLYPSAADVRELMR